MFKPVSAKEERLLPVYVYGSESLEHQAQISRGKGFMLHSQISVCYSGEGVFTDHNNVSHKVQSGDVMGGYALIELMMFLGYSKSGVIYLTENIKEKVYQNFKTIIELNNSNTENAHSICSRLLYIVLFDIASCIEGNPNNSKANLIKPCINYIKSNYMHDISISALAEMIKVTPTYLGIIFKKVYNITPQKFLTNIRIEKSKQLLVNNKNMSLSDVAINSGFNSESYFCNTFKKYIGITPTEYRSINTFGEI